MVRASPQICRSSPLNPVGDATNVDAFFEHAAETKGGGTGTEGHVNKYTRLMLVGGG